MTITTSLLPSSLGLVRRRPNGFRRMPLAGVGASVRSAMLALAERSCRADVHSYLLPRLDAYDDAIVRFKSGELQAFQLIQEREIDGERYVYLGPLFSTAGACIPLFTSFFESLADDKRPFHLLAEVQSPRVALVLKRLFLRTSFPRIRRAALPARVTAIASRFASALPHVGPFDDALTVHSAETLQRSASGYEAVAAWMARRGADLYQGGTQAFVVSCGSRAARELARLDLWMGASALQDWRVCKARMIARFERAVS